MQGTGNKSLVRWYPRISTVKREWRGVLFSFGWAQTRAKPWRHEGWPWFTHSIGGTFRAAPGCALRLLTKSRTFAETTQPSIFSVSAKGHIRYSAQPCGRPTLFSGPYLLPWMDACIILGWETPYIGIYSFYWGHELFLAERQDFYYPSYQLLPIP